VPEELRSRIFEPFFTTKDVGEGMGIGLDLSWRIVLAHGGALRLRDDRPGETVFSVRLPAAGRG
jgi:signal transduction histidine kinase